MFTIHATSEAFAHLREVMADTDTYKVSLAHNAALDECAIKRNEGMWTAPLDTGPRDLADSATLPIDVRAARTLHRIALLPDVSKPEEQSARAMRFGVRAAVRDDRIADADRQLRNLLRYEHQLTSRG